MDLMLLSMPMMALAIWILAIFITVINYMPQLANDVVTLVFDETWESCTPGSYATEPVTGSDEPNWDIADNGVTHINVPNPASDYVEMDASASSFYFNYTNVGGDLSNEYYTFKVYLPTGVSSYIILFLYSSNASSNAMKITIDSARDVYCNSAGILERLSLDTWYLFKVKVNHAAQTINVNINGNDYNDKAWFSVGAITTISRFSSFSAGGLRRFGRMTVGNGWPT